MNEFKGTPGPWEKDGVEIRGATQHQSECICVMTPGYEREDALLIAAAPELLKALKLMVSTYPYNPPCHGWESQVEAHVAAKQAIAKALGQPK